MILPKFEYRKANTLEEALSLWNFYDEKAVYLAGGTDLIPRIKLRLQKPRALIDLGGIRDLKGIKEEENWIRIGALTTLYELQKERSMEEFYPSLFEALEATSCETLQMRGTVGGNILQETRCLFYNKSEFWRRAKGFCLKMGGQRCHVTLSSECLSNYQSDLAPALLSLKAKVRFIGPKGKREVELKEIYTLKGEKPFDLRPGEILIDLSFPKVKTPGGYEKLRVRGAIDYPLVGAALSLLNGRGRLSIGAIGPAPILKEFELDKFREVKEELKRELRPINNTVLDPLYRREMALVLSNRLWNRLLNKESQT